MKRFVFAWAVLCLLAGCSAGTREPDLFIEPAQLTREEKDILELAGVSPGNIYDFRVDGQAESLVIRTYRLQDGKWVPAVDFQNFYALDGEEGRLLLQTGILAQGGEARMALQQEDGVASSNYERLGEELPAGTQTATSCLAERTPVVYGEEIPLAVQIVTRTDEVTSYMVEYYFQPEAYEGKGYDAVYAVTATFGRENPVSG